MRHPTFFRPPLICLYLWYADKYPQWSTPQWKDIKSLGKSPAKKQPRCHALPQRPSDAAMLQMVQTAHGKRMRRDLLGEESSMSVVAWVWELEPMTTKLFQGMWYLSPTLLLQTCWLFFCWSTLLCWWAASRTNRRGQNTYKLFGMASSCTMVTTEFSVNTLVACSLWCHLRGTETKVGAKGVETPWSSPLKLVLASTQFCSRRKGGMNHANARLLTVSSRGLDQCARNFLTVPATSFAPSGRACEVILFYSTLLCSLFPAVYTMSIHKFCLRCWSWLPWTFGNCSSKVSQCKVDTGVFRSWLERVTSSGTAKSP